MAGVIIIESLIIMFLYRENAKKAEDIQKYANYSLIRVNNNSGQTINSAIESYKNEENKNDNSNEEKTSSAKEDLNEDWRQIRSKGWIDLNSIEAEGNIVSMREKVSLEGGYNPHNKKEAISKYLYDCENKKSALSSYTEYYLDGHVFRMEIDNDHTSFYGNDGNLISQNNEKGLYWNDVPPDKYVEAIFYFACEVLNPNKKKQ